MLEILFFFLYFVCVCVCVPLVLYNFFYILLVKWMMKRWRAARYVQIEVGFGKGKSKHPLIFKTK